jgi:hypothetical protein
VSTGIYANPDLVNVGDGGLVSDPNLPGLTVYQLQPGSPMIDAGLSIPPPTGIAPPTADFFGDAVPQGAGYDIGAYESGGQLAPVTTPPPIITPPVVTPPVVTPPVVTPPSNSDSPASLTSVDIGAVKPAGSAVFANNTYTINGSGANINDSADAFHYDYTTLAGDGTIIAQISSLSNTSGWAKAGLMLRDGNSAGAAEVSMLISPNGTAEFETRAAANQTTVDTDAVETGARWEKLVRSGNSFTGYVSKDGQTWIKIGSTTFNADSSLEVGLAVTSRVTGSLETAVFSNVSIS